MQVHVLTLHRVELGLLIVVVHRRLTGSMFVCSLKVPFLVLP
jgi:hypothetical protein